jgi:hypothetical protein
MPQPDIRRKTAALAARATERSIVTDVIFIKFLGSKHIETRA